MAERTATVLLEHCLKQLKLPTMLRDYASVAAVCGRENVSFETFLLRPHLEGYRTPDERYNFLFNSYYNAIGEQFARPSRGLPCWSNSRRGPPRPR